MDSRFIQTHREARWAFGLAVAYVVSWSLFAWVADNQPGILGLPRWFELSCLLIPLIFVLLCWLMIHWVFKDISLEDNHEPTD